MSRTRLYHNYDFNSDFETRREEVVDQDFGHQNDSMSQPPLYLTPLGINTTNRTTSPSDSIPDRTKSPEPTPLTLITDSPAPPTDFPEQNGKADVPGDPDPEPSLSNALSKKSNSSNYTNSSQSNKKKLDKKKNC